MLVHGMSNRMSISSRLINRFVSDGTAIEDTLLAGAWHSVGKYTVLIDMYYYLEALAVARP